MSIRVEQILKDLRGRLDVVEMELVEARKAADEIGERVLTLERLLQSVSKKNAKDSQVTHVGN